MTKTKPTPTDPEVRTPAPPEETPATPGPGEAVAAIQQEAADRVAAAQAEIDRLKAELAAAQESLTREMRESGERWAEIQELKARLADRPAAAAAGAPVGSGWYEVSVPGCTLPKRVVRADTAAEALAKYQTEMGVTAFGTGPVVVPADPPEEAPPAP